MQKIQSFQGLRGFAILSVMISHCVFYRNSFGENALSSLGGLGVEIFIILSGYLTFYRHYDNFDALADIRFISCLKNMFDKMKKYYYLHFVTAMFAVIFVYKALFIECQLKQWCVLIINLLLLQTWIPKSSVYFSYNGVAWYLSITVFFVLMTPYILKYLKKLSVKCIVYLMMIIIIGEYVWALCIPYGELRHWFIYVLPVVRMFDFVLGGGTYILFNSIKDKLIKRRWMCIAVTVLVLAIYTMILSFTVETKDSFYAVAPWSIPTIALIGIIGLFHEYENIFNSKILVFIGDISFELFLIHQLVIRYMEVANNKVSLKFDDFMLYGMAIIISIVVAYFTNKYLVRR